MRYQRASWQVLLVERMPIASIGRCLLSVEPRIALAGIVARTNGFKSANTRISRSSKHLGKAMAFVLEKIFKRTL